jgi:transposase InsO family protein
MFEILVFGYMEHLYSGRDIAKACKTDIRFMWLLNGEPAPSHATISRFQDERLKEVMEGLFYQFVEKLYSQYTSEAFKNALQKAGLCQSLSGTEHCFDNARMESFFATLKKEKIYQISAYKLTREQVKTIIFRYIFVYYNRIRITSFNPGGLAPVAYREWARSTLTCAA